MAKPSNGRGALAAGGLAAILASTCCLGPLVLITLGFSGAASSGPPAPVHRTTCVPCPRCEQPTR